MLCSAHNQDPFLVQTGATMPSTITHIHQNTHLLVHWPSASAAWPRPAHPGSGFHRPLRGKRCKTTHHQLASNIKKTNLLMMIIFSPRLPRPNHACTHNSAPPKRRSIKALALRSCLYSTSSVFFLYKRKESHEVQLVAGKCSVGSPPALLPSSHAPVP